MSEVMVEVNREMFIGLYNKYIKRDGADKLLAWLEKSDFFVAPASTRYHLSCEGGLCTHSLHVFDRLLNLEFARCVGELDDAARETIAIVSLLHDLCKVNFYTVEMRNVKDANGRWVQEPRFAIEDSLPYGHGETSAYIISGFMHLTREEAMAIRWHMGGFDNAVKGGDYSLNGAWAQFPIGMQLHVADLQATYLDEVEA